MCIKIGHSSGQCIKLGYSSGQCNKIGYSSVQSFKIGYSSGHVLRSEMSLSSIGHGGVRNGEGGPFPIWGLQWV